MKLVGKAGNLLGANAAFAVLEQEEDVGRDDYMRDLDGFDPETRQFVETQLVPEQIRTHDAMRALIQHA